MAEDYYHIDEDGDEVTIYADTYDPNSRIVLNRRGCRIPAQERQAAAQALAGNNYRVIAGDVPHVHWLTAHPDEPCPVCGQKVPQWEREVLAREVQAAQPDRPEPVDPESVKVGDIVTVEPEDGSWTVRGEVDNVDPGSSYPFRVLVPHMHAGGIWPRLGPSNIRILQRPEPEPDEAAVEALAKLLAQVDRSLDLNNVVEPDLYARELVRRGVEVPTHE